jgi:hypothetical protein
VDQSMNASDVVQLARIDKSIARCSSCDHRLWKICDDHLEELIDEGIKGWRFVGDVFRPTAYHTNQRQRARSKLNDTNPLGSDRSETRDRLKRNQFGRGINHTGVPATRSDLEQIPVARNTANKILLDLVRWELLPAQGTLADENTVTVFDGIHSGVFVRKHERQASELSPGLSAALRLPAKVECPRCGVVSLIPKA